MGEWFATHWFECIETVGVISGLAFTAYTVRKDERSRQITNLILVNARYGDIWKIFYDHPDLSRVLKKDIDLAKDPITNNEWLFVKMLILHLDTVRRAMKMGMFVRLQGLKNDVREFISLPIPRAIWETIKPFQDDDFIAFVESSLN